MPAHVSGDTPNDQSGQFIDPMNDAGSAAAFADAMSEKGKNEKPEPGDRHAGCRKGPFFIARVAQGTGTDHADGVQ